MSLRARSHEKRFEQLPIPASQLEAGVFNPDNTLVPWGAIATLRLRAADLQHRLGIRFLDSHDDLDELRIALIGLPSAQRVALVEHLHAPVAGTEVHANVTGAPHAADVLADVLQALKLSAADVAWRRYGPYVG